MRNRAGMEALEEYSRRESGVEFNNMFREFPSEIDSVRKNRAEIPLKEAGRTEDAKYWLLTWYSAAVIVIAAIL